MAAAVALSCAVAAAQQPAVTIEGGPDPTGHVYEWQVTNQSRSAIVGIEFPHFGASVFFAPQHWTVSCTNLVNVGMGETFGTCRANAPAPKDAIATGGAAAFRMQCAARQGRTGLGSVKVDLADGTQLSVPGVRLPQRESLSDRFVPLIGLGFLAIIFLIYKGAASRRRRAATD
jgi:hypothetical protein